MISLGVASPYRGTYPLSTASGPKSLSDNVLTILQSETSSPVDISRHENGLLQGRAGKIGMIERLLGPGVDDVVVSAGEDNQEIGLIGVELLLESLEGIGSPLGLLLVSSPGTLVEALKPEEGVVAVQVAGEVLLGEWPGEFDAGPRVMGVDRNVVAVLGEVLDGVVDLAGLFIGQHRAFGCEHCFILAVSGIVLAYRIKRRQSPKDSYSSVA